MSSTTSKVYLVTGSARGIGRGLVSSLLAQPQTTVIAAVRTAGNETANSLSSLPQGEGSKLIVSKIDSASEKDAGLAVASLVEQGIDHLDVVIANAGIATQWGPVAETPLEKMREHFEVNVLGPLSLFQATLPLLKKATELGSAAKFVVISSVSGSIGSIDGEKFPLPAYGSSKAAVNLLVRQAHFDNPDIVTLSMHPGWTASDLGNSGAQIAGLPEAPVPLADSVTGILSQIDNATKETTSGGFVDWEGKILPW